MAIATPSVYGPRVRSGNVPEVEALYNVLNCATEEEALEAARVAAPETYLLQQAGGGRLLYRMELEAWPAGAALWLCVVRYTVTTPTNESEEDWDFSTESAHVTHALETVAQYPAPGKTAPQTHHALNLDENGIAGADVDVPRVDLNETHYRTAAAFNLAYRQACAGVIARVNAAPFRGMAAGEVLCARITARRRGLGDYQLQYSFRLAPNATDLAVGTITGITKRGWDYLWTMTEPAVDATAEKLVRQPVCANVERVRYYADFSALEIGE